MADYKTIKGTKIQNYTTDPDNPLTGQVWYNETDQVLKVNAGPIVNAWATANDMNTARANLAGAGIQTAALGFGGDTPPPVTAVTESYNGTSWTEVNDLNTARAFLAGTGTQTAALAFGGFELSPPPTAPQYNVVFTESWDGTNWTEVNDLNTGRYALAGAGIQTSALAFGGNTIPFATLRSETESWNGTSWTEVNDLNSGRYQLSGCGADNTNALAFGGTPAPGSSAQTESWNGTSWTEVNDLNTARQYLGAAGINTSALAFGGRTPEAVPNDQSALTESWNGTSWTEVNDLNTARTQLAGAGTTNASALAMGGEGIVSPALASTEEWGETGGNKTITSS